MAIEHRNSRSDEPVMPVDELLGLVIDGLEELKGVDIKVLDVSSLTSITDRMVIASGTSTRHVQALASNVALKAKRAGFPALGVEGEQAAEWVLVDLGDVVVPGKVVVCWRQ
jgi:ribosome-associated protein